MSEIEATLNEESIPELELELTPKSEEYLFETAKWTKFIVMMYIGFFSIIIISVITIQMIYGDSEYIFFDSGLLIAIFMFLLMISILYIPLYFLLKFSRNIKKAFLNRESNLFDIGFSALKSHYKTILIMIVVYIVLVIISFLSQLLFIGK